MIGRAEILGGWRNVPFSRVHLKMAESSRMDENLFNKENLGQVGVEESSPVAHKKGIKDILDS